MNRKEFLVILLGLPFIALGAQFGRFLSESEGESDDPGCNDCPHTRSRHQWQSTIGDTHCLVLGCECGEYKEKPKVGG